MQQPKTNSTLDLVANESPSSQNLSRVDLSPNANNTADEQNSNQSKSFINFYFDPIKEFPSKLNKTFKSKLDEAKSNSAPGTSSAFGIAQWLSGTLIWSICFLLTVAMPIVLTIVGLFNLSNCEAKPSLPYLILSTGFVMTCSNLFNLAMSLDIPLLCNHKALSVELKNVIASLANIIFNVIAALLYIITAATALTVKASTTQQFGVDIMVAVPTIENLGAEISHPRPEQVGLTQGELNCGQTFYSFSYYFIVISIVATLLIVVSMSSAFAYNKYRAAIEQGSTPRQPQNQQPEP